LPLLTAPVLPAVALPSWTLNRAMMTMAITPQRSATSRSVENLIAISSSDSKARKKGKNRLSRDF
jgi:hypothetical protein